MKFANIMALCLSLCLNATAVTAQTPGDAGAPLSNASVDDFVNALKPKPVTRSLGRNLKVEPAKVDMTIGFDFDSARLQADSKPMLERLAAAMRTEQLSALRFQIEGHTDGKGSARYNEQLSARRAQSVLDFLAQQGVPTERLRPVGKGFAELLYPDDPNAAGNRRVRVLVIE